MGIDLQVCAPPPPQCYYTVPLDIAVPATRMVNDGIAAFCAARPDRFIGLGSVPLQDAGEAVRELERCMGPLGFKGVQVLTTSATRNCRTPPSSPSGPRRNGSARW